jgi:hypothetical protein
MSKYSGSGWRNQSQRHSNARKTGRAGGKYATHPIAGGLSKKSIPQVKKELIEQGYSGFRTKKTPTGYYDLYYTKHYKLKDSDSDGVPDKYDCRPFDSSKQDSSNTKTFPLKDGYEIVAHYEKTRNGFRHIAILYDKYGHEVDRAKIPYQNRTWESYEYESVLNRLLDQSGVLTEPDKKAFLKNGELKAKEETEQRFGTIANIAKMGDILGDTQKEKNDWKKRMIKAGLPELNIPEDWETLSEDEKEKRLNKVIEQMN